MKAISSLWRTALNGWRAALVPLAAAIWVAPGAYAQDADLLRRLDALEKRLSESEERLRARSAELTEAVARIHALESRLDGEPAQAEIRSAIAPAAPPPPTAAGIAAMHGHDATELGPVPRMTLAGFGDIDFGRDVYQASPNSFSFGSLDLYITSRLAGRTSVLMETVFEPNDANALGVDIERILLQQRISRYLRLEAGRNHSAIGYYNGAFHHGSWFQTAAARPFLFAFEDEGGPLPMHIVGVRASGEIPSGPAELQYTVEAGNGRDYRPGLEPVQNAIDHVGKAVNFAVSASPDATPGLHLGVSAYQARLAWDGLIPLRQDIFAGYGVYDRGRVEFLNEAVWMRHEQSGRITSISGGYTQFAYRIGLWRPYTRWEYLNANRGGPVALLALPEGGVRRQASVGLRYDFTEFAALKFQYGRLIQESLRPANLTAIQLAFRF